MRNEQQESGSFANIKGRKTHANLKTAFARESEMIQQCLYFAKIADIEGYTELAELFREIAEGGMMGAHGNLDYLKQVGDPENDLPFGKSIENLQVALHSEAHAVSDIYLAMADEARDDGLFDITSWFETLSKIKRTHVERFNDMLTQMQSEKDMEGM